MSSLTSPSALVILDGFGYRKEAHNNAIAHARTPTLDHLWNTYPHALLEASGRAVGLPKSYIGNSQIGHRIIGAGRIVEQPLTILNNALVDGQLKSETLVQLYQQLSRTGGSLHIMGLLSDAGVHSHINHLFAFIKTAEKHGVKNIILHLFLDGRDVPPHSALKYIKKLNKKMATTTATICIGSLAGRFYAMDRDENWDRTEKSYRALTQKFGKQFNSAEDALQHYYTTGLTDEFIPPTQLNCFQPIQNGDGVVFFNFRPDRAHQLTTAFTAPSFKTFTRNKIDLAFFVTPFPYGPTVHSTALWALPRIEKSLKEVLLAAGKTIFSIAETEKYAHITYFFAGEDHDLGMAGTTILIPSIKSKDYVNHPCMSAQTITDTVVNSIKEKPFDFYLINYANADMVGHSGNFDATVKAVECLDKQIKELYDTLVIDREGILFITADHGNAEDMSSEWITSHTRHAVPFMMIKKNLKDTRQALTLTQLSAIAPFILKQLALPIPKEMQS